MKEFTEFVVAWINTGFEWYEKDHNLILKYQFGHDWNNDYLRKTYQTPEIKVPRSVKDGMCALVTALIITMGHRTKDVDRIITYLRTGKDTDSGAHIYEAGTPETIRSIKEIAYAMKKFLELTDVKI